MVLTLSNHVFGEGQLSLAKYLLMVAHEDDPHLNVNDKEAQHIQNASIGKEICTFKPRPQLIRLIIAHAEE